MYWHGYLISEGSVYTNISTTHFTPGLTCKLILLDLVSNLKYLLENITTIKSGISIGGVLLLLLLFSFCFLIVFISCSYACLVKQMPLWIFLGGGSVFAYFVWNFHILFHRLSKCKFNMKRELKIFCMY